MAPTDQRRSYEDLAAENGELRALVERLSLRRRSGRKPGGQPGHPGSTLALVANPNKRLRHEPGPCGGCGAGLVDAPEVGVEQRQVFDLPPMTVRVSEHQLIARRCAAGPRRAARRRRM